MQRDDRVTRKHIEKHELFVKQEDTGVVVRKVARVHPVDLGVETHVCVVTVDRGHRRYVDAMLAIRRVQIKYASQSIQHGSAKPGALNPVDGWRFIRLISEKVRVRV